MVSVLDERGVWVNLGVGVLSRSISGGGKVWGGCCCESTVLVSSLDKNTVGLEVLGWMVEVGLVTPVPRHCLLARNYWLERNGHNK